MVPVELELGETDEDAEVRSLLVVFGGWSGPRGRFLNDLHALDVNTLEWTELRPEGDVPEPRGGHAACCVGTDLYVFGGANDVEQFGDLYRYDFVANTWTRLKQRGTKPSGRSGHAACALGDGQVLAFGGHNGHRALSDIYVLDLATWAWRERKVPTGHPLARSGHTVTLAGEARFLICGGFSRTGFINDVHALDVCPRHVRRLAVEGGPHSSAVRKAAVEFSGAAGRALPLAVQWFRSKNGGPFLRVPGATGMAYAPTADDIHARLGVACLPCRGTSPLGPSLFAAAPEVTMDPELGNLVKRIIGKGVAEFAVEILERDGGSAPMALLFDHGSVSVKDAKKVLRLKQPYHRQFKIILSQRVPTNFVLQVDQTASIPFAAPQPQERDLIALVGRGLWALDISRRTQQARDEALQKMHEAHDQKKKQREKGGKKKGGSSKWPAFLGGAKAKKQ